MHKIRAVTLSSYFAVACQVGIDGDKLLTEANIKRSDLQDGEAPLPAAAVVELLENSARVANCDSFGLRLAQTRTFASLGPLSLLLQHVSTVREVIETTISFHHYLSDVVFLALEQREEVSLISFELIPPYRKPQATGLILGIGLMMLRGASGGRWEPEAVHFTHGPPKDRAAFEAYFRAPLEFASRFNGLSCPTGSLNIPIPHADRAMANNARRLLRIVASQGKQPLASDRAKEAIVLSLSSGRATLDGVAAQLNQTARSLQRRLEAEGRTFGGLLNELRRELAEEYLAGPHRLSWISGELGYATLSSFSRWFQNEFGTTPSEWRDAQRKSATRPPALWRV